MKHKSIILYLCFSAFFYVDTEARSRLSNISIYHDVLGNINTGYNLMSMEQNGEFNVASKLIYPSDIVFDVGASKGEWSEAVLSNITEAEIYAFEPIPDSFSLLQNNLGNKLKAYQIALSNSVGQRTIYCCLGSLPLNQLSSLYKRPILTSHYKFTTTPLTVATNTIDSFCKSKKINHIDFLKIDAEGAEYEILQGAEQMLKKQKITIIQFEYGGCFRDAKATLKEVIIFLTQNNYSLFRIIPDGLLHIDKWYPNLENYTFSNYLAVVANQTEGYGLTEDL